MNKYADFARTKPFLTAFALALGAAISLGLARFSYGLFLPLMREDLGWSYLLAGTMNTANAAGYFIGALITPWCFKKSSVAKTFIVGSILTAFFIGLSGLVIGSFELISFRILSGIASALVFVGGGVLAAQLGAMHSARSGLILGIYYGGTGLGIILSSLLVPVLTLWAEQQLWPHAWQAAWIGIAFAALILSIALIRPSLAVPVLQVKAQTGESTSIAKYRYIVVGYCCFGMGYIGYMTFVIALLKQMGVQAWSLNIFYSLLGICVIASSRIWAGMLDKFKGGQSMAVLNTLLAIACFIPAGIALNLQSSGALTANAQLTLLELACIYLSGIIFGSSFLSAVASTTAFVKHNLPQNQWVSGIMVFTTIFAFGQILGPTLVGWISDGGGLSRGLLLSGVILLVGASIAWYQKPLASKSD